MNAVIAAPWGQPLTLGLALVIGAAFVLALFLGLALEKCVCVTGAPAVSRTQASAKNASEDAFRRGLTHLMADHADQAIEEFTRAVTLNSDTVETYVVLGNLFRQKGEIERAVRLRQSIIARPNLQKSVRLQALYDLGLDYRKGGLFNRAVESFREVLALDPQHVEACRQTVSLYEEVREWEKAFEAARRLDKLTGLYSRPVLAHYKTELGKEFMAADQLERAEEALEQAISIYKGCLDAYLHLGDLELARGRVRRALNVWRKALRLEPTHAHLVVTRMAAAEVQVGERAASAFFDELDTSQADVTTLLALAERFHRMGGDERALELLSLAVKKDPGNLSAHRLRGEILLDQGRRELALNAYADLLKHIDGDWASYQCRHCGFVSHQLTWKCPRCHQWDSMSPRRTASV
jgi:lipopolysaccharide biosynthesis regulator YciM